MTRLLTSDELATLQAAGPDRVIERLQALMVARKVAASAVVAHGMDLVRSARAEESTSC